jgi:hypothetical protein
MRQLLGSQSSWLLRVQRLLDLSFSVCSAPGPAFLLCPTDPCRFTFFTPLIIKSLLGVSVSSCHV